MTRTTAPKYGSRLGGSNHGWRDRDEAVRAAVARTHHDHSTVRQEGRALLETASSEQAGSILAGDQIAAEGVGEQMLSRKRGVQRLKVRGKPFRPTFLVGAASIVFDHHAHTPERVVLARAVPLQGLGNATVGHE